MSAASGPARYRERFAIVTIGRFGWTGHVTGHDPDQVAKTSMVSHGGETWKAHDMLDDETVIVDTRQLSAEDTYRLAMHGPIIEPGLAPGRRNRLGDGTQAWDPRPQPGSIDARLGDARGMDMVAVDVYVQIAERFGAQISTGADARTPA